MKILKGIALALAGIVALALIVALFVKKEYAVERQISINKPKQEVFDYIKLLKNQQYYSVWEKADPNAIHGFRGIDGTIGAVSSWKSKVKEVGSGEQEILEMIDGEHIDYELRFFEPFQSKDHAYFDTTAPSANTTLVKWGFEGKMNYPMNLMLLFMNMEEMLGKDLQGGLDNLKTELEKE
jgi:hypothetical protein